MTIYSPITLTKKVIETFNPTRLYIKKLAGYYYFGKTGLADVESYTGSGKKMESHH